MIWGLGNVITEGRSDPRDTIHREEGYGIEWTTSQIIDLDETLRGIVMRRDKRADLVLGPKVADSINVYRKARETMLPKFSEIFPLGWMPMFENM